jgi:hypothetical protein
MYRESMLSVAAIHNGFLIEVRAPFKRKEDDDDDSKTICCGPMYGEKEIFAKDATQLGKMISDLIPMLEKEFEIFLK